MEILYLVVMTQLFTSLNGNLCQDKNRCFLFSSYGYHILATDKLCHIFCKFGVQSFTLSKTYLSRYRLRFSQQVPQQTFPWISLAVMAQLFTSLKENLCQDKNGGFVFSSYKIFSLRLMASFTNVLMEQIFQGYFSVLLKQKLTMLQIRVG